MACNKNNTSSVCDLYERSALYCPEDILCVSRAEDEEQKRRIADKEGENHKRVLANNMSVMLGENLRAEWFQHGSPFVLSLLSSVRSAAYHTASAISITVASKAGEAAHNVTVLAQEKAVDLKDKGLETAQGAKSWLSGKTSEYTQWLKDAVTSMTVYKKVGDFIGHTNMTFALLEEEKERNFRMNSSSEINRIENALKVASLIKGLHCQSSDPEAFFNTRVQEERERSFRLNSSCERLAIKNASKVASCIKKLSPELYRPTFEPNAYYGAKLLQEQAFDVPHKEFEEERNFRMNSKSEIFAIENALKVASLIKGLHSQCVDPEALFNTRVLEERERSFRLNSSCERLAIKNASQVASCIKKLSPALYRPTSEPNSDYAAKLLQEQAFEPTLVPQKVEVKVEPPVQEFKRAYTAAM